MRGTALGVKTVPGDINFHPFPKMKALKRSAVYLCMLFAPPALAQNGDITYLAGETRVIHAGQKAVVLTRGIKIREGDVISTSLGGAVRFRAANYAEIDVREKSSLRMERDHIVLLRGTLCANTKWMIPDDRAIFKIQTRVAMIGFRGSETIVRHADDDRTTTVFTAMGSNIITSVDGFPPLITKPNDTVQVVMGQAPRLIAASPGLSDSKPPAE